MSAQAEADGGERHGAMNAGPRGNERPMGRTPLTPVHCELMNEVCRCNPDGWHSQPSAFEPAEVPPVA